MVREHKVNLNNNEHRFARRRSHRGRRSGGSGGQRQEHFRKNNGRYADGIKKGRGRGGISKQKNVDDVWIRHVFPGSYNVSKAREIVHTNMGTKLVVSNIHFGITDRDIQEMFAEFRYVRRAAVHYDKFGKSLGTAQVIFENKTDALRAMRLYNGILLNGREINIQLVTSDIPSLVGKKSNGSDKIFQKKRPLEAKGERSKEIPRPKGGVGKLNNQRPLQGKGRTPKGIPKPKEGVGEFNNKRPVQGKGRTTEETSNIEVRITGNGRKCQNKSPLHRTGQSTKGRGRQNLKTNKEKKTPTAEELDAELDAYFKERLDNVKTEVSEELA